ncbi:MAG: CPBP family intramembrane metalloprotease [Gemmatimonadota bacterium]|nr:MAG: CPBP family intramembrane metalloprotease [Gemmatimonadota bacterium]
MMELGTEKRMAGRLRAAVVRRPAIEPFVFVALALLYIWVVRATEDWLKIPFLTVIVLIPFASNFLHRDGLRDLGLRLDNFWTSAREVGIATLIGVIAIVGVGLLTGGGPNFPRGVVRSFLLYPVWGLAQQYAMQSFTYRRVREGSGRPVMAAAITALLFASAHWPNLSLTLMTLVGGYVWCRLFERHPNLITLALSHGWLAVLLRYSWPAEWLHNLRIGPGYWTWMP